MSTSLSNPQSGRGLNPRQTVGKRVKLRPMGIGTSNALRRIRDREADIQRMAPKQQPCAKIYLVAAPARTPRPRRVLDRSTTIGDRIDRQTLLLAVFNSTARRQRSAPRTN
ncbi:hypothetical protein [Microcoleus sp. herbarium2]|uniref:hypothetical protein n=1 Tax=Microcoleus sp. herbarium2 TaxID=3055433 RepID=UPI002FCEC961